MSRPLVLLPGMNCSAQLWNGCGLGHAVDVALTQPTLHAQVDAVLAILDEPAVLIGLSLGANVAMATLRRAPERVAGLCVISSNAKAPTSTQLAAWAGQRRRLAGGEGARALQAELLDVLLGPAARADATLVRRTLAMAEEVGDAGLDAQLQLQATRVDERPGLASLRAPTLVISGRDDALCPPSFADEIAAVVPGCRLETVPAGHLAPMEAPALVGRLITDWTATF